MDAYPIITILIFLAAFFGYINVRFFKLPTMIGLMLRKHYFSNRLTLEKLVKRTQPQVEEKQND